MPFVTTREMISEEVKRAYERIKKHQEKIANYNIPDEIISEIESIGIEKYHIKRIKDEQFFPRNFGFLQNGFITELFLFCASFPIFTIVIILFLIILGNAGSS